MYFPNPLQPVPRLPIAYESSRQRNESVQSLVLAVFFFSELPIAAQCIAREIGKTKILFFFNERPVLRTFLLCLVSMYTYIQTLLFPSFIIFVIIEGKQ